MKTVHKNIKPERPGAAQGNFYKPLENSIGPGMNERIQKLRKLSFEAEPSLSIERALIQTNFYKENFLQQLQVFVVLYFYVQFFS